MNKKHKHGGCDAAELKLSKKMAIMGFLAAAFMGVNAEGGQDTTINTAENTNIYGNHDGTNHDTYSSDPNDNTVTVDPGANVGEVYGAFTNGTASGNTVHVRGGIMTDVGGVSALRDVSGNSVVIEGGQVSHVMGADTTLGEMTGNSVTVSGGTILESVDGARSMSSGNAVNNRVTISGGSFSSWVQGATVVQGYATDNSVTITGGTIINHTKGGAYSGVVGATVGQRAGSVTGANNVERNSVTISGSATQIDVTYTSGAAPGYGSIIGGKGGTNTGGIDNTVTISQVNGSGYVKADLIYGAYAQQEVRNNSVSVADSIVAGKIFGAESKFADAKNNQVTVSGSSQLTGDIYGAQGDYGEVSGNRVTLSENTGLIKVTGSVSGGQSYQGLVQNNEVKLRGNTEITGTVYGGRSYASVGLGKGIVEKNSVTAEGKNKFGGTIYGGMNYKTTPTADDSHVSENLVSLKGETTVGGYIMGGYTAYGDVLKNKVELSGKTEVTSGVYGGYSARSDVRENEVSIAGEYNSPTSVYGGLSANADAMENRVSLNGDAVISGNLMGAYSGAGNAEGNTLDVRGKLQADASVFGGYAPGGDAKDNSVNLDGEMNLASNLYGGYAPTGEASGNSVTLNGDITIAAGLYGGFSNVLSADNTLTVKHKGISVGSLGGFQEMVFHVDRTADNGATMITVSDTAEIDGAHVSLALFGASTPIREGYKVILIDAEQSTGGLSGDPQNDKAKATLGVSLEYEFDVYTEDNKLIASLPEDPEPEPAPEPEPEKPKPVEPAPVPTPTVNPQLKSLMEGWLAGMTQLVRGGDLAADSLSGLSVDAEPGQKKTGWIPFAKITGSRLRHETGSHIDTRGINLIAGISGGKTTRGGGSAIGGVFFEYGRGNYDTYNSFIGRAAIHGVGDTIYAGGGVLGRINFKSKTDAHAYLEGSLRGGRIKINYDSRTLKDAMGTVAAYHGNAGYMSAHMAAGRVIKFSNEATLDIKAGYYWTKMNSTEATLTTGEKIDFEGVNSHRVKIGARLSGDEKKAVKPYIGLALEREFSAKARGSVYGYKIDPPSLKGTTVVGDAGLLITPGKKDGLMIELGVQAHAGRRKGISGGVKFGYKF
ncbi:MAG: hypothetical protein LBQ97_07775 [Fusobacteriaceae bacterium]|jgi:hypothetical protein|nr:hypothetical protein [Fusobacteriaceae bacterium]